MGQISKSKYGVLHEYAEASRRKADGGKKRIADASTGTTDSAADNASDNAPGGAPVNAAGNIGSRDRAEENTGAGISPGNPEKRRRFSVADSVGLTSQIAVSTLVCVLIGLLAGRALDARLNTSPILLIIGVILGAVAAFKALYDVAKKKWMG